MFSLSFLIDLEDNRNIFVRLITNSFISNLHIDFERTVNYLIRNIGRHFRIILYIDFRSRIS